MLNLAIPLPFWHPLLQFFLPRRLKWQIVTMPLAFSLSLMNCPKVEDLLTQMSNRASARLLTSPCQHSADLKHLLGQTRNGIQIERI